MKKTVGVYFTPETDMAIKQRGTNRSHIIARDLARLYRMYERALREVPLTYNEACLLVDALNGYMPDIASAKYLWAEVEDAVRLGELDKKWQVDGTVLMEKLRGLSLLHCMALIDAVERFWVLSESENGETLDRIKKIFNILAADNKSK
jgi:hypothetical protein